MFLILPLAHRAYACAKAERQEGWCRHRDILSSPFIDVDASAWLGVWRCVALCGCVRPWLTRGPIGRETWSARALHVDRFGLDVGPSSRCKRGALGPKAWRAQALYGSVWLCRRGRVRPRVWLGVALWGRYHIPHIARHKHPPPSLLQPHRATTPHTVWCSGWCGYGHACGHVAACGNTCPQTKNASAGPAVELAAWRSTY